MFQCHHNIIFGKVNNLVPLPPVYIREVSNYSQANVENNKYVILIGVKLLKIFL